jgi:Polyketide cyclase / dehydrase and lipid transport
MLKKVILVAAGATAVLAGGVAIVGSVMTTHVLTVTRTTSATSEAVWQQWEDVPNRTRWDQGLEWARIDGAFVTGAGGEVKLKGQPPRRFEILEARPPTTYTDRFFLPLGAQMDWLHSVEDVGGNQRQVTFRIEVSGPTSLLLTPILKHILKDEIPATVDKLVEIAEQGAVPTR